MFNPRLLIQLPLIFLGSCVPLTPNTSINIYTNTDGKLVERRITPADETVCRSIDVDLVKNYKKPKTPTLEGIDPTDSKAIIKELTTHIKVLNQDINKLLAAANCGQRIPDK